MWKSDSEVGAKSKYKAHSLSVFSVYLFIYSNDFMKAGQSGTEEGEREFDFFYLRIQDGWGHECGDIMRGTGT